MKRVTTRTKRIEEELKTRTGMKVKRAKTSRVPTFKLFVDPEKAAKKQKKIAKQFFISTKRITITPLKEVKQEEVQMTITDRKSTRPSTARISLLTQPYKSKVDHITDEIVEIVRKKLSQIKSEQRKDLNTKDELNVILKNSKDDVQIALNELDSRKEMLQRIKFVNEKLETDCKELNDSVDKVQDKINDLKKIHRDNMETVITSINSTHERKQDIAKEIQEYVEISEQEESQFLKEKAMYQRLIDEKAREILDLKTELRELGVKETYRVGRFVSDTHAIEVSINGIKSLGELKRNSKRSKSIRFKP